ncbi:MAG: glycosyltransferase [Pseudanabaenaceae cyanobacterium bins.68]|nr:glycosyltransferase [Pseudanabaenaceae cyanobacterium bins.68]
MKEGQKFGWYSDKIKQYWRRSRQIWQAEGLGRLLYLLGGKLKSKLGQISGLAAWWRQVQPQLARAKGWAKTWQTQQPPLPLSFRSELEPQITIIIGAHGRPDLTYNCLAAIAPWLHGSNWQVEIILIETLLGTELQVPVAGIWRFTLSDQGNLPRIMQRAQAKAQGQLILFLRHDVLLSEAAFDQMVQTYKRDRPGILFPRLSHPNRELVSGGGRIDPAGHLQNLGAGDFDGEPDYNYRRQLDFGLPIAFLLERASWQKLDLKTSEHWSSLEAIADWCLQLKYHHNFTILYQPKAQVICDYGYRVESLASPRHFWQTWQQDLADSQRSPTILIIDTLVPAHDKESGALRLFQIMGILLNLGYRLIFLPDQGHEQEPYTSELEEMGIEVLYFTYKQQDWRDRLVKRLDLIHLAWVCRPELCEKYFPILQTKPEIKLIYDTIDLHFLRLKRAEQLNPSQPQPWQRIQALEFHFAQTADLTVVVTPVEQEILLQAQAQAVQVIPNIHQIYQGQIPPFSDRQGILFIGGYYHQPNVDAVLWLCEEIMPLVWQTHPEISLTLLGSNPPGVVKALESDRVSVPGYIPQVEPYFLNHRVFVAPLRFGAGMKGKIGQSLSYGLPTITTTIGAEGMGLCDQENVLIAEDSQAIAEAIEQLYFDPYLWQKLSQASFEVIRPYTITAVQQRIQTMLSSLMAVH